MKTPVWGSVLLLALVLAGATGCTYPTIRDTTVLPWQGGDDSTKVFRAVTTNADNARVLLQFSSHRWLPIAHEVVVPRNPSDPNVFVFSAVGPGLGPFVNTQRVFYRWLVMGGGPNDLETIYAQTPDLEHQVGCPPGKRDADLRADQAAVLALVGPLVTLSNNADYLALVAKGYATLTHGWASTAGMGIAIGRLPALAGATPPPPPGSFPLPPLGSPGLLFYAPAAGVDPTNQVPDFPYTLVGWGYGTDFNPTARPTLGCLPFDAWFLHEAGWHEADGSFTPTPPSGGSATINAPPLWPPHAPAAWHPRIWDMHLWLDTTTGIPAMGPTHPTITIPGYPSGAGFFPLPLTP